MSEELAATSKDEVSALDAMGLVGEGGLFEAQIQSELLVLFNS